MIKAIGKKMDCLLQFLRQMDRRFNAKEKSCVCRGPNLILGSLFTRKETTVYTKVVLGHWRFRGRAIQIFTTDFGLFLSPNKPKVP